MSTVPNSSESFGTIPNLPSRGRPPVLSDTQLLALATELNRKFGRPPKADELITAAGGCQRQRALQVLRNLAQGVAKKSVRGQLVFPLLIEDSLRELMQRWMDHAAEQLAQRHSEMISDNNEKHQRLSAYIDELTSQTGRLEIDLKEINDARRIAIARVDQLEAEVDRLRLACLTSQTLAEERGRLLVQLRPILNRKPRGGKATTESEAL